MAGSLDAECVGRGVEERRWSEPRSLRRRFGAVSVESDSEELTG